MQKKYLGLKIGYLLKLGHSIKLAVARILFNHYCLLQNSDFYQLEFRSALREKEMRTKNITS